MAGKTLCQTGIINNLNTNLLDKHCADMKVVSHVNAGRTVVLMGKVFVGGSQYEC